MLLTRKCYVRIMASQFTPSYFDRNFKRLVGLKVYATSHQNIDKVKDLKAAGDIVANGLRVKGSSNEFLEMLRNTVNKHFHGLKSIRQTPFWKLHIDVAIAVFNNRYRTINLICIYNINSVQRLIKVYFKILKMY